MSRCLKDVQTCYIMAFTKMFSLIILLWILQSINVGGQEDHFTTVHDAVDRMLNDQMNNIENPILEVYMNKNTDFTTDAPTVVVLQKTNNSVYILDTTGSMIQTVQKDSIGHRLLSDFMNERLVFLDSRVEIGIHKAPSDMDVFVINGIMCYTYNLTLADSDNGTFIEAVSYDFCGGSTLTSFMVGKPSQFCHLKGITLRRAPITELTIENLIHFPELQFLTLESIKNIYMENGLLCYNLNMTLLDYRNSSGSLTVFPRQIFNCTMPLKLEYFYLQDHNIASLPARAFGSAAEQLRVLWLIYIGLEVIHKDAFTGFMNLQYVCIVNNNLLHTLGAMIPPSTCLKVISCMDYRLDRNLNLTMHITRKSHLQMFQWSVPRISGIIGSFCSNESKSELEIIFLEGINYDKSNSKVETIHFRGNTSMGEALAANVFAHCISLKVISIAQTGLAYLPDGLFSTNISQLETLLLAGNKLDSNTSWSTVLRPLHELKHLNLSVNLLTSWSHNLSSLWSLEILDLSHNAITKVSHMAFMNITRLKFLSLQNNNIAFLAPKVQHALSHISLLNLRINNIHTLNMLNETMFSDFIIVDVSANNLMQLDMPLERKCSLQCGKISLFGDNNKLSQFVLPCSNTHQYATVSLTNNNFTEFSSIFPSVLVQQCSIETLSVSGNDFIVWFLTQRMKLYKYALNRMLLNEPPHTHNISTLDMTHCGIEFIDPVAFFIFNIQFLDLRGNDIVTLPIMHPHKVFFPYPSVLVVRSNPIRW